MTEEIQKGNECKNGNVRAGDGAEHERSVSAGASKPGFGSPQPAAQHRKPHADGLKSAQFMKKSMRTKFYDEERMFARSMARLEAAPLGTMNRELIKKFVSVLGAEGVGKHRMVKYVFHLTVIAKILVIEFPDARKDDMIRVFADIEQRSYSPWTKRDFRVVCKRFYKWLRNSEGYPREVRWLKGTLGKVSRKLPEDMLSVDEIKRMAAAADNLRDRALVLVLYESGCRIGEVGGLRIGSIKFDRQFGAVVTVSGKTGMRRVRIVGSAPALAAWLEVHSFRDNPEAPVWIGIGQVGRHEALSHASIAMTLKRLAVRAGIKKRVHAHLFRHSRATELASKLTEAQLKEMFGWTQSSTQPATYVHLSGRNVDDAILKLNGLLPKTDDEEPPLKPHCCPRCDTQNTANAVFCRRCGMPFSELAIIQADEQRGQWDKVMSQLVDDPDVRSLLARKIGEMNLPLPS